MTATVSGPNLNSPIVLVPGENLVIDSGDVVRRVGPLSTLDQDLLTLSASIFAADLIVRRGEREAFTRNIDLVVGLVNQPAFSTFIPAIERILYLLTDDNWSLNITRVAGELEQPTAREPSDGKTLLFSGGLDSFSAAIEELEAGNDLVLVSHQTGNRTTKGSQDACYDYLSSVFADKVSRIAAKVTGRSTRLYPFPRDKDREYTQRSRSFLFLALAAIVARATGNYQILMIAENGQMAVHLPMTAARIGAFSTKTAHPQYIDEMQAFLSQLLGCGLRITNPFLYRTKSECVSRVTARHPGAVTRTVSCWKSARQAEPHCGICVPCMIRRIAIESHGLKVDSYHRDLFVENILGLADDDEGKRNLVELIEFVLWFGSAMSDTELELEFPELVNMHFDKAKVIAMYRRFAGEARAVFAAYPQILGVM